MTVSSPTCLPGHSFAEHALLQKPASNSRGMSRVILSALVLLGEFGWSFHFPSSTLSFVISAAGFMSQSCVHKQNLVLLDGMMHRCLNGPVALCQH